MPPLPESLPQPNDVVLSSTHYCAIRWMSQGFIAVPTLAGHMNVKKESVYHYLSDLKKAGFDIEVKSTGNRRGGYRNIYRLARPA
jgi:predicted transcriptional regulator